MSISVFIPTVQRRALIRATLDSSLNQTMPPVEIILVDDSLAVRMWELLVIPAIKNMSAS